MFPTRGGAAAPAVTLENCAREPIHIPGSIQSHGAILVLDSAGTLLSHSANAAAMLRLPLVLQTTLDGIGIDPAVRQLVRDCLAEVEGGEAPPIALETIIGDARFDCIIHAHQGLVIVEYERRDVPSDAVSVFALKAHGAIERLRRQKTVAALLQSAVDQIRVITGFDRVMAYRFRHDDSGEVVAEACLATLEPYLGRRYPASDIPPQARRLYVVNTLRLISDVGYVASPMVGRADAAPLDMSYCVLRSVSPIHLEYLKNMGVAASMSISIVINGHLWGLIACHHQAARQVPYSIRMAADVMAQVLAAEVQALEMRERTALIEHAAELRTRVMASLLRDEDALAALTPHAGELCLSLGAGAVIIVDAGRIHVHGEVAPEVVAAVLDSLPVQGADMVTRSGRDDWPAPQRAACGRWVGLLALRFDAAAPGWLLALREEQTEAVRWAGQPGKIIAHGPLGPRLTPRGSFAEWRETVVGQAEPWQAVHAIIARQLLAEMNTASVARHMVADKARSQLLAMLGHDLRNPLQTITMAASALERGGSQEMVGRRIKASSGRMARLIAQVMDMSLITGGMRLGRSREAFDLVPLVTDLVDEVQMARPGITLRAELPACAMVNGDPGRIAQVVDNLISNACHHGQAGEPVLIVLLKDADGLLLEISNVADEIDADSARTLYDPFKRSGHQQKRNRDGMGLGLYIAQQIMHEHGGGIAYVYQPPRVVFRVRFAPGA
ncbi:GAF domain-containing protein [Duganella sp. SAP-35]|uniref:histidine kinase n=1 Tax=Duganella aceris TaxID=2703883 RepID=A0ABX0FGA0_9BURK|nr:GAF domain-containing protein [Duganella aceris]